MTEPRDPHDPEDPSAVSGDPSATARMPVPDPATPSDAADGQTRWTPPAPDWSPQRPEPAARTTAQASPPAAPSPAEPSTPVSPPAWTTPSPAAPSWRPARADDGRGPSLIFGLLLVAVGLWFFAEQTLGLDLPTLRWSQLWPLILIVVGVWVLFGARRRTR